MASPQIVGQFARMTTSENNTTNEHTNQSKTALESSPQGNLQASPATGIDTNFNDSGFCDCEEEPNSRRYDYEDWILFPGEIPLVSTDNFFADLDVSMKGSHDGVYENTSNIERETAYRAQNRRSTTFYDPVHEAARASIDQSVYGAINSYNVQSQPDYSRPAYDAPIPSPFQRWHNTYEKHESLAYRLSQPSNSARTQHSRQPSRRSVHQSRSR
jgi:hypothetical protein